MSTALIEVMDSCTRLPRTQESVMDPPAIVCPSSVPEYYGPVFSCQGVCEEVWTVITPSKNGMQLGLHVCFGGVN